MSGLKTTAEERARFRGAYETCGFSDIREMKILRDLETCIAVLQEIQNASHDRNGYDMTRAIEKAQALLASR
jgi:hypothetical protein